MAGFVNTNLANFSKGNVGSRLGATEWGHVASHRIHGKDFKPHAESTESAELIFKPHVESAEWIFRNTNLANFSKGNVGSRLGATEWTGTLRKCPKIACRIWQKVPDKALEWRWC